MNEAYNDLTIATPACESSDDSILPVARWNVVGWGGIALVFAVGSWIRWTIATGDLLWLDELHTGWAVDGSFGQMLSRSAQGNQAPLFFGLTWSTIQVLGPSEFSLRLVSLLTGTLAMGLAARIVWLRTQSIAGATLTLSLIALDENFIWYSTEARPYALLHLISVVQASCFWRSYERWRAGDSGKVTRHVEHRLSIVGLLLSSWALVYTHYTGVFLLATEFIFLCSALFVRWLNRELVAGTIKQIFVTLVLFAVGCMPLLLQMNQALGKPSDWSSVALLNQFTLEQTMNGICWFGIPLMAVLFSAATLAVVQRKSSVANRDGCQNIGWLIWVATWFLVPLLLLAALQIWAGIPIALSRYLSVALIAGPIFAGGLIGSFSRQNRWLAIPLILLAILLVHVLNYRLTLNDRFKSHSDRLPYNRIMAWVVQKGQLPLLRHENWKSPIEVINNSTDKAKWPLFLFGAVIEDASALSDPDTDFQAYLQFPVRSLYRIDFADRVVFAGPTIQDQHFDDRYLTDVIDQGGAWILVRHHSEVTQEIANQLEGLVRASLGNTDATIETNWFGNRDNVIHLISIEIKK